MNPPIDVILNRNARLLGEHSALRRTIHEAARRGGAVVHETHRLGELERLSHEIASRGTRGVVLAGGDGSYMAGLSALARAFPTLPPVALAPGGTVCTVAKNLECWGPRGVRDKVCVRAERVVTAACRGAARVDRRPTLRVRDDTGGDRLGFIFGAGLVTRFFDVYYDAPRPGLGSAARIAAAVLGGSFVGSRLARRVLEPVRCSLVVGGEPHPSRAWSLVLASVVRDVGLHFLATYRGGEELERFHVVASGLPPRALAPQLPRVLAGRPLAGEPRVDSLARSLSVAFEDADGYVLDGELLRAAEVHVDVGPVISVLSPPPEDSA